MLDRTQDHPKIADQKNNFDNVRFCLALIVFFSHALGLPNNTSLAYFYQFFNATYAVEGFFAISGYLVYASFKNSKSLKDFFDKRIRRIAPAYFLTILFCILIGLLFGELEWNEFIFSDQTLRYFFSNILFLNFLQPTLPGLFNGNPIQIVNGSFWTIKIEIMLYVMVPIIAYSFKKVGLYLPYFMFLILGAVWVFYFSKVTNLTLGPEVARQFPGQLPYFAFGCLLAAAPKLIRWLPLVSVTGFLIISYSGPYSYFTRLLIEPIAYGGITLFLCMLKPFKIDIGKMGDLSYGIYLFHFPIVQLLIHLNVYQLNPYFGVLMSLAFTLFMSFISWRYLESRWLKRNSHYLVSTSR